MNLIEKIANRVEQRIEARIKNGDLPKTGAKLEDANYELWNGAFMGAEIMGADKKSLDWIGNVIVLIIGTRGYAETKHIAAEGRKKEEAENAPVTAPAG